jgi:urate oxidase/2-oxo-4-hydroxy-4-carboxy-5-ureidoimidazoline decarboxylase
MADPVGISYGKGAVSVYRADADGDYLFAAEVELLIQGGEVFVPSYTEGDNSVVVATDSMKNFIHSCGLTFRGLGIEDFLSYVGRRFLERYEHVEQVRLEGREITFQRRGEALYQQTSADRATAWLAMTREGIVDHRSGREWLHLVKLKGSAFTGFVRDEYTTLPEALDRPLFVHLDVHWRHADFGRRVRTEQVRDEVMATFDDFVSESIQHLLHEMGTRLLTRFRDIDLVELDGQNRLWDTAQTAEGATVYTDARPPFGVIHLTLER